MPPIQAQEQFEDLVYPSQGVDVSVEYGQQTQLTTPLGINVRTFEPLLNRARGGSRAGLSKYILGQLSSVGLVQLIDYIVFPNDDALLTTADALDGDGLGGIPDPSTNNNLTFPGWPVGGFGERNPGAQFDGSGNIIPDTGRYVRTGGSAISLNRNVATFGQGSGPGKGILFVQSNAVVINGLESGGVSFLSSVGAGDLIIVAVSSTGNDSAFTPGTFTITDTRGNTYTQLNGYSPTPTQYNTDFNNGIGDDRPIALFACISITAGPCFVTANCSNGNGDILLGILDYTGVKAASYLDGIAVNYFGQFFDASMYVTHEAPTPGNVSVNTPGELVIAAFFQSYAGAAEANVSYGPGAGFTRRVNLFDNNFQLLVIDMLASAATTPTATGGDSVPANQLTYSSIGASFRHA